jgi:hypothetical protein
LHLFCVTKITSRKKNRHGLLFTIQSTLPKAPNTHVLSVQPPDTQAFKEQVEAGVDRGHNLIVVGVFVLESEAMNV